MTIRTGVTPEGFTVIEPSEVEGGDGFYISYNDYDISIYGGDTTALVLGQFQHFYILNGDHRKEFRPLIGLGFHECMKYFKKNQDKRNKYSEIPKEG